MQCHFDGNVNKGTGGFDLVLNTTGIRVFFRLDKTRTASLPSRISKGDLFILATTIKFNPVDTPLSPYFPHELFMSFCSCRSSIPVGCSLGAYFLNCNLYDKSNGIWKDLSNCSRFFASLRENNLKLRLPDPRTCSPWRWIFSGKTGSPPVATLTLSPLDERVAIWRAAWQNWGPADETLSAETKYSRSSRKRSTKMSDLMVAYQTFDCVHNKCVGKKVFFEYSNRRIED